MYYAPASESRLTCYIQLRLMPAHAQAVEAAPEEAYTEDTTDFHGELTHSHEIPLRGSQADSCIELQLCNLNSANALHGI